MHVVINLFTDKGDLLTKPGLLVVAHAENSIIMRAINIFFIYSTY